jgi:serine/threonine protein kinase
MDLNLLGDPCRFTCKDLDITTKGFNSKEMLGHGGFGSVYKNTLSDTSAFVAMKKIAHDSYQCGHEFIAKVN